MTLILCAACGGKTRLFDGSRKPLNYAQYCSLEQGMEAEKILKAFGPASDVREEDGKVRGLTYPCEDSDGKVLQLRMVFTPEARLDRWVLKDPKAPAEPPAGKPAPEPRADS